MTTSVAASALAELLQEPRLHMYTQPHASSKKKKSIGRNLNCLLRSGWQDGGWHRKLVSRKSQSRSGKQIHWW